MATVKLSYNASLLNSANQFVVALALASNPGVNIEVVNPTGPYVSPWQITFLTSLTPGVIYIAVLWESASTSPAGTVRDSHSFDPSQSGATIRTNLNLIADTSPGLTSGLTKYTDPSNSLAGSIYTLFRVGGSPLMLGIDYTLDSNNNWTLIDGTTIQPSERYVLVFQPSIGATSIPPPPSLISSGLVITGNVTMDATYINKQLILQGSGPSITTILPPLSAVTDFQRIIISSNGGSHINAAIPTSGTDKIQYKGLITQIVLGQGENAELYRMTISGTSYWFVANDLRGFDSVGQFVESYAASIPNGLLVNGQQVAKTSYIRATTWANANVSIVSSTTWIHTNGSGFFDQKGNWWQPSDATKIGLPDLTIHGFRRAKNASGVFEQMDVMPHPHEQQVYTAVNNGGRKPVGFSGTLNDLGGSGVFTLPSTGTETRPNSTGINLFVLI